MILSHRRCGDFRQLARSARQTELRQQTRHFPTPGGRLPGLGRGHVPPPDPPHVSAQGRVSAPNGETGADSLLSLGMC